MPSWSGCPSHRTPCTCRWRPAGGSRPSNHICTYLCICVCIYAGVYTKCNIHIPMCLYICMYTPACVHTCAYMYKPIDTYTNLCIHTYITCMHTYIHTYLRACVRACVRARVRACARACVRACVHTYVRTYMLRQTGLDWYQRHVAVYDTITTIRHVRTTILVRLEARAVIVALLFPYFEPQTTSSSERERLEATIWLLTSFVQMVAKTVRNPHSRAIHGPK